MSLELIAVFGIFQVLLFLIHAATYQVLAASFGLRWAWLAWLFTILSISFVSSSMLAHTFCNAFVRWYYRISGYWFGLSLFLFGGAASFFIITTLLYSFNIYFSPAILGTITLGGMFLLHSYATWQTNQIQVMRIDAPLPNLPHGWHGKKIAFVSDVHLGAIRGEGFSKKIVSAIAKESPEMILIGGDIFDGVKCHTTSMIEPFTKLKTPQGTYFASGNHEYYVDDIKILLKQISNGGIHILDNESVDINGIQFAGVDWKDTKKEGEFEKVLAGMHIDKNKPSILIRHEPSHLEVAERAGISLTLSGHTHAGQIWPLQMITRRIYKGFDYGFKRLGGMMVYTSSGVGTWGPPLRFCTKSEIVIITLI